MQSFETQTRDRGVQALSADHPSPPHSPQFPGGNSMSGSSQLKGFEPDHGMSDRGAGSGHGRDEGPGSNPGSDFSAQEALFKGKFSDADSSGSDSSGNDSPQGHVPQGFPIESGHTRVPGSKLQVALSSFGYHLWRWAGPEIVSLLGVLIGYPGIFFEDKLWRIADFLSTCLLGLVGARMWRLRATKEMPWLWWFLMLFFFQPFWHMKGIFSKWHDSFYVEQGVLSFGVAGMLAVRLWRVDRLAFWLAFPCVVVKMAVDVMMALAAPWKLRAFSETGKWLGDFFNRGDQFFALIWLGWQGLMQPSKRRGWGWIYTGVLALFFGQIAVNLFFANYRMVHGMNAPGALSKIQGALLIGMQALMWILAIVLDRRIEVLMLVWILCGLVPFVALFFFS